MFRKYQSMFAPVAHFTETYESTTPITTHPTLQDQWMTELEEASAELHEQAQLTSEDADTFERIQRLYVDGMKLFLDRAKSLSWIKKSPEEKKAHLSSLLLKPQTVQRTPEWYLQGQQILTASEFSSLYGSERQYASLVMTKAMPPQIREGPNKLACPTEEMSPFDWGIRFEPVVKQAFEQKWGVKIVDSGRLVHPTDTHLAASPDGLIMESVDPKRLGRLLEIKCPISRTVGSGLPFDYWCQMQIQMEVADIDECEYLEVRVDSKRKMVPFTAPTEYSMNGTMWLYTKNMTYVYAYTEEESTKLLSEGYELFETIPWYIHTFHNEVVQRDRAWFADTKGAREQFWKDVAAAKAGTFVLPPPTVPKKKAAVECQIQDSPPL